MEDAYVCAYTALYYWYWGTEHCEVIGDTETGYIVTPVDDEARRRLAEARQRSRKMMTPPPPTPITVSAFGPPQRSAVAAHPMDERGERALARLIALADRGPEGQKQVGVLLAVAASLAEKRFGEDDETAST